MDGTIMHVCLPDGGNLQQHKGSQYIPPVPSKLSTLIGKFWHLATRCGQKFRNTDLI